MQNLSSLRLRIATRSSVSSSKLGCDTCDRAPRHSSNDIRHNDMQHDGFDCDTRPKHCMSVEQVASNKSSLLPKIK